MTYCVGLLMRGGLVMLSDTRTNAGIDQISTYSKVEIWERPGDRVFCLMTSGNLAISQEVVSLLEEEMTESGTNIMTTHNMFRAAQTVGKTVRAVYSTDGREIEAQSTDFSVSLLLGGQIRGEQPRLFQIYSAGNFVEASVARRAQVRQADPRSGHAVRDHASQRPEAQPDFHGFDLALEPVRRHACRCLRLPGGRVRGGVAKAHRRGRSLFHGAAQAVGGGPAR